ncbi:CRISPR-associated helicase Cas3' [Lacticaseibacillus pabuli]|uniref:CRISPR-associated helicase Cas3 n=1 Tax=Lacticaseibacillus pabuli TaxID=3025672 RepID=A0ABY7WUT5_9LACO|nr:CRISPR-associated helicase Cas3' [Lacticaseibacillus sp. KACC 23028]WDF83243.1 CRISPR-associated helicase Cas3' [Lacticaseibacillus sp. KACC 23028]
MSDNSFKLSDASKAIWAKKRTSADGEQMWLPLVVHLDDTRRVINWLYNEWLSDGQKQLFTSMMSADDTQRLVKFVGGIHDIGKASPAFECQPSYSWNANPDLDQALIEKLIQAGFANLDANTLSARRLSPHARAGEAILDWLRVPNTVSTLIGGHHGMPENSVKEVRCQISEYTSNYWQHDTDAAIQKHWQDVQKNIFQWALHMAGYESVDEIPEITEPQGVILEGLLIMADWLASSEFVDEKHQDSEMFSLITTDQTADDIDAEARFELAMTNWDRSGEWHPQKVDLTDDPYRVRWHFDARPVQKAVTTAIDKTVEPGPVIIEAPMGLGKTEIALVAAEQLAYKTKRQGIFFGLPTQATSNAMFDRVTEWVKYLATTQDDSFSVELMHSKRAFNKTFTKLPIATNVGNQEDSVVINSWFTGKKTILDEFSVGTVDNLLQMALKQKHLALRHLGLSKKVVVIDEVHAYDAYMDGYLYRALEWLGAYHVPVVILSATLPKDKRNDLLAAYFHGKYGISLKRGVDESEVGPDWRNQESYPLVTMLDGRKLRQVTHFSTQSDQKPQSLRITRANFDDEELIDDVLSKIAGGGVAGIIVNTVKRAQMIAKQIPDGVDSMVLHSAFTAPDRADRENELQHAIGKNGKRPHKMIVVGTQVLEQSLDIDFDVLYTDIAPMDLLLQRTGRMHRHNISRPDALRDPQVIVMGIEGSGEYGDANEGIYTKYLLMKTDYFLADVIQIPTDISRLVQLVYNVDDDPDVEGLSDAKGEFEKKLLHEKKKATVFQIGMPKYKGDVSLHGWLKRAQEGVDKDEQFASAAVRDIQETVEVILTRHNDQGDYLLDGRKLTECSDMEIAQQVVRLPAVTTRDITNTITELEKITGQLYRSWQDSTWLRGALALPLDDNLSAVLNGWQLQYSRQYGLSYEKEDDNG